MSAPLRWAVAGLVLVNLAFVYITEASRWIWLGPLVGLTLAAPLLARFNTLLPWRLAWNGAVLAVFAQLVSHVAEAGVAHLLEDGLLLAALCQVHLLNNLSRLQKPDLLFFNSFLVAVVTSFLSFDAGYCVVFLLYAPFLVGALQLNALPEGAGPALRRVLGDAFLRSAAVLGLTLMVFFFWPRDFGRRGLLGDRIRLSPGGARVDFSEEVSLAPSGRAFSSDRVVFRARLQQGRPLQVPSHWRGATLDHFDGEDWRAGGGVYTMQAWKRAQHGEWLRAGGEADVRLDVEFPSAGGARLFTPLNATRLRLDGSSGPRWVQPRPDLTLRCAEPDRDAPPLRYALALNTKSRPPGGAMGSPWDARVRDHVQLLPGAVPPLARQLAREVRNALPQDAPQHHVVERMRRLVSERYRYLAPGEEGAARSLAEFVNGGAGGHCEYFATLLAILLRSEGIPARLVTGYRSLEWNEEGTELVVRERHAHAWVEVLDPEAGWYSVDGTPAAAEAAQSAGGLFARLRALVGALWDQVTGFNQKGRDRILAWLLAAPGRIVEAPTLPLGIVAAAVLAVLWRRRRRGPRAVLAYERSVARAGIAPLAGETPRELLARARARAIPGNRLRDLAEATETHEQLRYAHGPGGCGYGTRSVPPKV